MKSCPESKESPKDEMQHSRPFLKKALAMKSAAKKPAPFGKSSSKGKA